MPYCVSSFDTFADGMERLRNRDEFILLGYADPDTGVEEIRQQWLDDIQSCDRFEGFDYDAARAAVNEFVDDNIGWIRSELVIASAVISEVLEEAGGGEEEPVTFRLYVQFPEEESE